MNAQLKESYSKLKTFLSLPLVNGDRFCYDKSDKHADVAELADALDLGSSFARSEGSSPFIRIKKMYNRKLNFSAIVLAGGQSSRMGRDKASIPIRGVPLIQQVCEVAAQCASPVYVVTPWIERYQEILQSISEVILTREVPCLETGKFQGPLVGFAQGLAQVQTDWVLLLACDMPCLRAEVLQESAAKLEKVPEKAIALLPRHPKGWEPLCGFYRQRSISLLNEFINQGGRSFQHWLGQHSVEELLLPDSQVLFNCNTPGDLTAIRTI